MIKQKKRGGYMMLIVLDSNPVDAANKVPDKLKFKQLLELAQMICSCGYCDIYKAIPQGKAIQEWIKKNPAWVKTYGVILYYWCIQNINLKENTMTDLFSIISSIPKPCNLNSKIETAIFRYNKNYKSIFPSDSEITIENAIEEYTKYMDWKKNV